MANRTVKEAVSIKGTNPQYLVEKIIRTRIYDSRYWKEECFGLTAELLVDKAIELKSVGGSYGSSIKPAPFLCLILKMLQIQPDKDIVIEFIRNKDYKYIRALGAFYMRLTGTSAEIFKYLEPLYSDYRKMKRINKNAAYELIHVDEFIDELLHGDRVCDVALPRLQKRQVLEELNELEPRVSPLDINLDDIDTSSEEDEEGEEEEERDNEEDEDEDEDDEKVVEKKRDKDRHGKESSKGGRRGDERQKSEAVKRPKHKFVDYDNPDPEDEMPRYRRSPDRDDDRRKHHSSKSRRRSRSRSDSKSSEDDDRDRRRHHSSSHHRRHKDRHRDRSRSRERRRSRDRSDSRSRSRDRHHGERRRRRSRS